MYPPLRIVAVFAGLLLPNLVMAQETAPQRWIAVITRANGQTITLAARTSGTPKLIYAEGENGKPQEVYTANDGNPFLTLLDTQRRARAILVVNDPLRDGPLPLDIEADESELPPHKKATLSDMQAAFDGDSRLTLSDPFLREWGLLVLKAPEGAKSPVLSLLDRKGQQTSAFDAIPAGYLPVWRLDDGLLEIRGSLYILPKDALRVVYRTDNIDASLQEPGSDASSRGKRQTESITLLRANGKALDFKVDAPTSPKWVFYEAAGDKPYEIANSENGSFLFVKDEQNKVRVCIVMFADKMSATCHLSGPEDMPKMPLSPEQARRDLAGLQSLFKTGSRLKLIDMRGAELGTVGFRMLDYAKKPVLNYFDRKGQQQAEFGAEKSSPIWQLYDAAPGIRAYLWVLPPDVEKILYQDKDGKTHELTGVQKQ